MPYILWIIQSLYFRASVYINPENIHHMTPWEKHWKMRVIHSHTKNGVELILTSEILCLRADHFISQPIILPIHEITAFLCKSLDSGQPQNSEHSFISSDIISNSVICYVCRWGSSEDPAGSQSLSARLNLHYRFFLIFLQVQERLNRYIKEM